MTGRAHPQRRDDGVLNIASHLTDMARRQGERAAVIDDRSGRAWSFAKLNDEANAIAGGLEAAGINRGTRVVLMVPPSLDFFALTFAIFKAGAVPVMIDPGIGPRNIGRCIADATPEAFIGIAKAHIARRILGWGRETIRTNVSVGFSLGLGGRSLSSIRKTESKRTFEWAPTRASDLAAILFTSGSTGAPKGVVYTHSIFSAQLEALRSEFGIEPGETDLATFPLFGLFAPALGMSVVIPQMDATRPGSVDPRAIIGAIERHKPTMMFGSPALIKRVGRWGAARGVKVAALRRVISAGAPADNDALRDFATMLVDPAQIFTPYGATEALPVSVIGSREILSETAAKESEGMGICVGRPAGDVEIAVIAVSDFPIQQWSEKLRLPKGQIGEIVVKGSVVTAEYFRRTDATSLAKISDPAGGLWHRMGDVGYIDEIGRLWFCGRKSQRVVTESETLFTVACERIFNAHPAVARTALVGVKQGTKIVPVLCVETGEGFRGDRDALTRELLEIGASKPQTRNIRSVLYHAKFPVDIRHNAKIQREQLAAWAAKKLS